MKEKYHINYAYLEEPLDFGSIRLYQLGRLYCMPGAVIGEHVHMNWYELTIVTDGRGWVSTNGHTLEMRKGDIHLSLPGDFHKLESSEDKPLKYDFFTFASLDPEISEAFQKVASDRRRHDRRILTEGRIGSFVSLAIGEFMESNAYRERMLALLLEKTDSLCFDR